MSAAEGFRGATAPGRRPPRAIRLRAVFVAALVAASVVALPPVAGSASSSIKANEARVRQLTSEIAALDARVKALQGQMNALAGRMGNARSAVAGTEYRIETAQAAGDRATQRLNRVRANLAGWARQIYIQGVPGPEVLLGSESLADLSARIAFVDRLQSRGQGIIENFAAQRSQLGHVADSLKGLRQTEKAGLDILSGQQNTLASEFALQKAAMDAAAAKRAELQTLIARAKLRAARDAGFRLFGGAGPFRVCPVDRPRAYSNDFGAPRYAGGYHSHKGIDMMAPRGTRIRAPFDGRAREDSSGLGGLAVYVDGRYGEVYNAHLSRYAGVNGDFVHAGDVIGYVGDSGDARGGATHDHFEWHPGGGRAVNAYRYLNLVC